jgi:Rad3-related DNA helicase
MIENSEKGPLTPLNFFPKAVPREKQLKLLRFIYNAVVNEGFKHLVMEVPTGGGKSPLAVAACSWAANQPDIPGMPGGYILTTQKLLQDQYAGDFTVAPHDVVSLKSAVEYSCPLSGDCMLGSKPKTLCAIRQEHAHWLAKGDTSSRRPPPCAYLEQRSAFMGSPRSLTNYPYFLTERIHVGQFSKRRVIVFDEAHSLERQILRFFDIVLLEKDLPSFAPMVLNVPVLDNVRDFVLWVKNVYHKEVAEQLGNLQSLSEGSHDAKMSKKISDLEQHVNRIERVVDLILADDSDWIYWQERDQDGLLVSTARPLSAAPFMGVLRDMAEIKIYMSAYLGDKDVFCRSLGVKRSEVAWARVSSTFPPSSRRIVMSMVGSMSKRNVEATLPSFLRIVERIIHRHSAEKGIIHGTSYKLCQVIFEHFSKMPNIASRIIFPQNADEREEKFKQHVNSPDPTILLSPSVTEGFDFIDDLARWQVISKCPWPNLADRQTLAKKEQDPEWYLCETVKTIIQSCGRIVRSEQDHGTTYILDSDFERLYHDARHMFPNWFTDAFVWPLKKS